ncbi:S-methyl-5-thioribose-1-phosphate isomerase [Acididesulfobacillus acetoxydans]|uniref:Methylthioribose-1-phosphate isomerase n=1 Tax=Acididesulfobacillus acetoxydans TaxID=1561005 RepID=A0A8S0X6P2_9FIRM|nr:S-methyl-5-thioribose-1-phosphate isomerase [Acididesulfobacillus acetoxydans]CAA7602720.1 S-methyl-5-thioribose-1-phosphate isomerase [Acididesulfobacillus acetoxydans]CEJ06423.1 Methylthioribose-1-phosphate isomerase [Acididesulfobacillus acetoxydans]
MKTIEWLGDSLRILDQTKLPVESVYLWTKSYEDVAGAIEHMQVRGAPAIGATAAYGFALGALAYEGSREGLDAYMEKVSARLESTRPTAVNLFWALRRMQDTLREARSVEDLAEVRKLLVQEADKIADDDRRMNRLLGEHGNALVPPKAAILTHCNAGSLATVDYGTALGVVRAAVAAGKEIKVYADETRPFLQGARLTAWELMQDGIPVTLIADNMAGFLMQQGKVDLVIVGADRIAANGDTANKIGTYSLAVLAHVHGIPFYVAAPTSTIDLKMAGGQDIPIEERAGKEIREFRGIPVAPADVPVYNPAFDVTPAKYITGIISEKGVVSPPYSVNFLKIMVRPS